MSESNELVVVKPKNIPALFKKDGCDPLLKRLHEELNKFEPDIETAKGRKEIASFANKFSKAKTLIDGHGKALVEEEKTRLKIVDAERKKFRDECDIMKQEARKPLTDWEDAEKKRVADIESRIEAFNNYLDIPEDYCSRDIAETLKAFKTLVVDESFEEFELAATKVKETVVTQLEAKFIVLQNAEKEKAEAERLEKERLAKEQKEREEKIAEEAAEQARQEAEEAAAAEAEEKDRLAKEAIEAAEKKTLEAKLETERVEREKREAAEQAEKDKDAAIEKEKQRQADQIKADEEAEEKRQANKRHRNKIHKEAKASMMEQGISEEDATIFVTMVKNGLIKHITINY